MTTNPKKDKTYTYVEPSPTVRQEAPLRPLFTIDNIEQDITITEYGAQYVAPDEVGLQVIYDTNVYDFGVFE